MSELKKGDSVKVTLEGTVTNIVPFGDDRIELRIEDGSGDVYYISPSKSNVEKVEPPVEVFEPGTIVRGKYSGRIKIVTKQGVIDSKTGSVIDLLEHATGRYFVRVSVG